MELLRASLILFAIHLRRMVLSKRALVCLVIVLAPVVAALGVARIAGEGGEGPPPALTIGWLLVVQAVVPIVALILGSAVVAEEIEDRTISYLFTRPIPRASVLLGRWLASLVLIAGLLAASTQVVFTILAKSAEASPEMRLPEGSIAAMQTIVLLGALVYSALFTAMGAFLKHPMIVGLAYTFGVEGFLANLPAASQGLTIQFYLKSHLAGRSAEILERMHWVRETDDLVSSPEALRTLLIVLAVALAVGCWTVSRKQYVLES